MLKKIAVNKKEIEKLMKNGLYDIAVKEVRALKEMIEIIAIRRVNKLIDERIILECEKSIFVSLIENNINNKLLEDKEYILLDESYILNIKNNANKKKIKAQ